MSLNLQALQAISLEHTGDGFLGLVSVTVPGNETPLRFVFNPEPVESMGRTFLPAFMDVRLSDQIPGEPGQATFSISGVPQISINQMFNAANEGAILVDIEFVLISDPDTIQKSNEGLTLRDFSVGQGDTVKGRLLGPTLFRQAYPGIRMDRSVVPGIFKTRP